MINLQIENFENKYFESPIKASELAREYQEKLKNPIMLCRVNGRLRELSTVIDEDASIEFVTNAEKAGMKTYERGLTLVFLKAVYKVGGSRLERCITEYGLGRGLYCSLVGEITPDDGFVNDVLSYMKQYIDEKLPIIKETRSTSKVRQHFKELGMHDKELLLKFRRSSATNVYSLGNFTDYFYGYMPDTTEKLSVFNVTRYKNGILLIFPDIKNPEKLGAVEKRDKLFETLEESNEWAKSIGVDYVGSLNKQISDGNSGELILLAEALQEKKIAQIAEMVRSSGDRRFIMIAGPSSSGKTTFSHRLSIQLRLVGFKPHAIGLDNYYKNRIDAPRDEYGNFDFECLEALDVKQFNEDMVKLLKGGEVEMPTFNFKTGLREYKGDRLKLGEKDILVIEGIHGLNDKLSYSLPELSKFKIYISALTQLNVDEHNRIPTTDARLLRRIVRDARTRGTSAKDTIAMWDSVRRGEEKYIFPYQEEADVMFNSALVYELCAIKQYAEPLLFGIEPDCKEYEEAKRLLKFLDYFQGINTETIPINSICREFIGGSCFNV
jgi:uridine kinase